MDNLNLYAEAFDRYYPNYADPRYEDIALLIERYAAPDVLARIHSEQFQQFSELLRPLIAIKNYKSQVPFPEDLAPVLGLVVRIRNTDVGEGDPFSNHSDYFRGLVQLQGFQLPTVSAIFHFCHRDSFPIVDVNVEAACQLLTDRYPTDFGSLSLPRLPAANTSPENKLAKYKEFIAFINRIVELQQEHMEAVDYRYVDKALMVLGKSSIRVEVEG